jgi:hypothetical protein
VAPDGYFDADVDIRETDSHGNYSGDVSDRSINTGKVIPWTGGEPRIPDALTSGVRPSGDKREPSFDRCTLNFCVD